MNHIETLQANLAFANNHFLGNPPLVAAFATGNLSQLHFYIAIDQQYLALSFSGCESIAFDSYDSRVHPADYLIGEHPEYRSHYLSDHLLMVQGPDSLGLTSFFLSFQFMEMTITCQHFEASLVEQLPTQPPPTTQVTQTIMREQHDDLVQALDTCFHSPLTTLSWSNQLDTLTLEFSEPIGPAKLALNQCQKVSFQRQPQAGQAHHLSETYYPEENRTYTCLHATTKEFLLACWFQQLALG